MRWVVVVLFCLAYSPVLRAADQGADQAGPLRLSLAQAVSLALESNPDLMAVREELPAAVARQAAAGSEGRLRASANTYLSTGDATDNVLSEAGSIMPPMDMTVPPVARATQNLTFLYPLSTGGRVGSDVAAAGARVQATRADIDRMALEVAYEVREAYWQVLLGEEIVKVRTENLAEQEERLRTDQVSYDAGKIPVYYVLRDKAEVAAAAQELTNAQRDLEIARLDLLVAMGQIPSAPIELTDTLASADAAAPPAVEALIATALADRPEARGLGSTRDAAARETDARRAAYRFQVDAMLMLDAEKVRGEPSDTGYTLGLVASLPVLDGGSRAAEVSEAEAMVRQVEKQQLALNLRIEREVRAALITLDAARRNLISAQEAVASAEEDYRVAMIRYQAGKAINLEPISALASLVQARTSLAQAQFDLHVALDGLDRATGRLPERTPPAP